MKIPIPLSLIKKDLRGHRETLTQFLYLINIQLPLFVQNFRNHALRAYLGQVILMKMMFLHKKFKRLGPGCGLKVIMFLFITFNKGPHDF